MWKFIKFNTNEARITEYTAKCISFILSLKQILFIFIKWYIMHTVDRMGNRMVKRGFPHVKLKKNVVIPFFSIERMHSQLQAHELEVTNNLNVLKHLLPSVNVPLF